MSVRFEAVYNRVVAEITGISDPAPQSQTKDSPLSGFFSPQQQQLQASDESALPEPQQTIGLTTAALMILPMSGSPEKIIRKPRPKYSIHLNIFVNKHSCKLAIFSEFNLNTYSINFIIRRAMAVFSG